jgi:hypothetical protein
MARKLKAQLFQELMDNNQQMEAEASASMANKAPRRKPDAASHDQWTDDAGVVFWVHRWKPECRDGCAIHAPSNHHMRDLPQIMRASTLIERHCSHGVGHPDPDSLRYFESVGQEHMGVHGCDGCCLE